MNSNASTGHARPTILIVEPSQTLRSVLSSQCEGRGASVKFVDDVPSALAEVAQSKPTAIITVVELEGLNGFSLLAALKSSPTHRAMPIVLLTSNAGPSTGACYYQPDHIVIKDGSMRDNLEHFLDSVGLSTRSDANPDTDPAALRGKRVLLAEDSIINQTVAGRILHVAGIEVVAVDDGVQAVIAIQEEPFDLVLMDIHMPNMGGYEAARILRSSGLTIPILALTGEEAENIDQDKASGTFDEILHKPIKREALLEACYEHIVGTKDQEQAA